MPAISDALRTARNNKPFPVLMVRITFQVFLVFLFSTTTAAAAMASSVSAAKFAGKRAIVTGSGRGIGRAIALALNREGCKVAIASRTPSELEETKSLAVNSDSILCCVSDVTDTDDVERMVKSAVDEWGGIDILVNNAGGSQTCKGPLDTLASGDLRRLLDLNVVGAHAVTAAVLRHMKAGGKIVNISSKAGKVGLPNYSFYVASKFALEGMSASLAAELKERGIAVNTLSPGMVNTRSFPKPPEKKGVRSAESVEESLFLLLESDVTGHYIHADELDKAVAKGLDATAALKPINESPFLL